MEIAIWQEVLNAPVNRYTANLMLHHERSRNSGGNCVSIVGRGWYVIPSVAIEWIPDARRTLCPPPPMWNPITVVAIVNPPVSTISVASPVMNDVIAMKDAAQSVEEPGIKENSGRLTGGVGWGILGAPCDNS